MASGSGSRPVSSGGFGSNGSSFISADDLARYTLQFDSLRVDTSNHLTGEKARGALLKSNLPKFTLSKIWELADTDGDGKLNLREFALAQFLVESTRKGRAVPDRLPANIRNEILSGPGALLALASVAAGPSALPPAQAQLAPAAAIPWRISPQEQAKYKPMFAGIDTAQTGVIATHQAMQFFAKSRQPQAVLDRVMQLVNAQMRANLNFEQFCVGMYLLMAKLNGQELPFTLPPDLIPPSFALDPSTNGTMTGVIVPTRTPPPPPSMAQPLVSSTPTSDFGGFANFAAIASSSTAAAATTTSGLVAVVPIQVATASTASRDKAEELQKRLDDVQKQRQQAEKRTEETLQAISVANSIQASSAAAVSSMTLALEAVTRQSSSLAERLSSQQRSIDAAHARRTELENEVALLSSKVTEVLAAAVSSPPVATPSPQLPVVSSPPLTQSPQSPPLAFDSPSAISADLDDSTFEGMTEEERVKAKARLMLQKRMAALASKRAQSSPSELVPADDDKVKADAAAAAQTAEKKRLAEEAERKHQAEEAKRRAEELERQRAIEEARRLAEMRLAEEAEKQRLADDAKRQAEEAEKKRLAEEHQAKEAQKKRLAEDAKRKAEAEEAKRKEEEARRQAEEAEKKRLAEKHQAEEAEKKRLAEKHQAEEAEKKRLAEDAKRKAEAEDAKRKEEEAKRNAAEAEQKLKEEKRQAEKRAEEKRRHEEAEQRRKEAEELERTQRQQQAKDMALKMEAARKQRELEEQSQFVTVRCIYAYTAVRTDELSFDVDDIVVVVKKNDDGWWFGHRKDAPDADGVFPSNYVEEIAVTPVQVVTPTAVTQPKSTPVIRAKVLYSYTAQRSDELSIEEGQTVVIVDQSGDWWTAQLGSSSGAVPSTYVQIIPEAPKTVSKPATGAGARPPPMVGPSPAAIKRKETIGKSPAFLAAEKAAAAQRASTAAAAPSRPVEQPRARQLEANDDEGSNIRLGSSQQQHDVWASRVDPSVVRSVSGEEKKRQEALFELILTEQIYVKKLALIVELFYDKVRTRLTIQEHQSIFSNVTELLKLNRKILEAFEKRQKQDKFFIVNFGDVLKTELRDLDPYLKYCGNHVLAIQTLSSKLKADPVFEHNVKVICEKPEFRALNGLDLSSFLLEPMQRMTRYPLLIRTILHHTPKEHPDQPVLLDALNLAEEWARRTNEAARQIDDSQQLQRLQRLIQLDKLQESLTLDGETRLLGRRQFIYEGVLHKDKSGKKLHVYLLNDLLLLCLEKGQHMTLYREPIPVNEILVREAPGSSADDTLFQLVHIEHIYNVRALTPTEKRKWMQTVTAAYEAYQAVIRKKQKALSASSLQPTNCVGTLEVSIIEGHNLAVMDPNGKADPFCEVQLESQVYKTKVVKKTLNPKWHQSHLFSISSLDIPVKFTVYDYDEYSEQKFMGTATLLIDFLEYYGSGKPTEVIKLPLTKNNKAGFGEVLVVLVYKSL